MAMYVSDSTWLTTVLIAKASFSANRSAAPTTGTSASYPPFCRTVRVRGKRFGACSTTSAFPRRLSRWRLRAKWMLRRRSTGAGYDNAVSRSAHPAHENEQWTSRMIWSQWLLLIHGGYMKPQIQDMRKYAFELQLMGCKQQFLNVRQIFFCDK
jgi:hypothetical protein